MNALQKTQSLSNKMEERLGVRMDFGHVNTLRRAEITLQHWYEQECGDGNNHGSWAIERDDNGDGPPFMVHHHYLHGRGKDYTTRTKIADREAGAIKRVKAICEQYGLHFYLQTDPRGCALYLGTEPLDRTNYTTKGVACCE